VRFKHGMSHQGGAYGSWQEMRRRCFNPNDRNWPNYGGRGISVCARWCGAEGFVNFYADMGQRPEGKTLDRINNNGHYEPSNCKWSTASEQARNRRPKSKHVCWKPQPLTLAQIRSWA
jgi:hypothetical protein